MMDHSAPISLDANDLLRKRERVIAKNGLRQAGREAETKTVVIKDESFGAVAWK
jgi:hypothetical protein